MTEKGGPMHGRSLAESLPQPDIFSKMVLPGKGEETTFQQTTAIVNGLMTAVFKGHTLCVPLALE